MKLRKVLTIAFVAVSILLATLSFYMYQVAWSKNFLTSAVGAQERSSQLLLIRTGTNFQQLIEQIKKQGLVNDVVSFAFLSKLMGYQENVKPGAYRIEANMNNISVVRMLRAGQQVPIRLTFNSIRLKKDFAKKISEQLELKPEDLLNALNNPTLVQAYGFDTTTIMGMFVPNTYEIYWNTSVEGFLQRMHKEYQTFWKPERKTKALEQGLTLVQVSILASIVEAETYQNTEKQRIAGVYLNRLRKNDLLQADPTVIYATGDFTIKRVLQSHLEYDSPYNTYKYRGLPPGPINIPSIASIDAVLNAERHDFYYFCAKEDFSGYHNFAVTHAEHLRNARLYQKALKEKGL